jgi:hypothetical protein
MTLKPKGSDIFFGLIALAPALYSATAEEEYPKSIAIQLLTPDVFGTVRLRSTSQS